MTICPWERNCQRQRNWEHRAPAQLPPSLLHSKVQTPRAAPHTGELHWAAQGAAPLDRQKGGKSRHYPCPGEAETEQYTRTGTGEHRSEDTRGDGPSSPGQSVATQRTTYCRYCYCLAILLLFTSETFIIMMFMEMEST